MASKHQVIRTLLTDAIIDLCRREAFYVEELRIEGTLCIVSDRSSVLVTQITEQIGEKKTEGDQSLPLLDYEHTREAEGKDVESREVKKVESKGSVEGDISRGSSEGLVRSFLEQEERQKKQKTQDQRDMMVLMPSERTDGKYKCPFCPKVYGFKHNLKDHINKHTGRKPHICKYCGMTFTFLASLCGHIKRRHFHCMPREHQCQICGNRFPNKQSLRQHFTWRHSPQKVMKKATASRQQVASPRQRKNSSPRQKHPGMDHEVKIDMEGEPISEDSIGDVPMPKLHKEEVLTVQNFHTKEEEAPIEEEMDLSQAIGLTHPERSTPPLPPPPPGPQSLMGLPLPLLQASSMGFQLFAPPPPLPLFTMPTSTAITRPSPSPTSPQEKPSLPVPELFRSPNGKFNCPYCEKSYRFKHTLKDHINTHFGKRPHVCKYCNDAFTHFASLCAHIKRRHKEHIPKDFACAICNDNFMNLQSLKQHFTWRHKEVKLPPGMPMFYGPGTGRKLNSGPEIPPRSSPTSTSTTLSPRQSPSQPVPSPSRLVPSPGSHGSTQSPNRPLLSPTSPTLPSMDAFIKGGGMALSSMPHCLLPDPIKDMIGVMNMESYAAGMLSPLGFLPPHSSTTSPSVNRENYN